MPLGFFSTLAAWIGIGVVEHSQRAMADRIAKENPLPSKFMEGSWPYDHWEADVLSYKSPVELREIFKTELEDDPPAIKVMLKKLGEIDWECYKGYPLDNVIQHCCICGISQKRKYDWKNPPRSRCNFCDQYGIRCKWENNRKLKKQKSNHKPYVFID